MSQAPGDQLEVDPDHFVAPPSREALYVPTINNNRHSVLETSHEVQQFHSPAITKVGESRIPGPAGQPSTISAPVRTQLHSGTSSGGDDPFTSPAWAGALRILGIPFFDEARPALHSTLRVAQSLQQSGRLPRLVAWVVSLQVSHTGECLIKLKDPTASMAGTLTAEVLPATPQLTKDSVVLLENVAVLRTPPPHAAHHLCIGVGNILHVVPRQSLASERHVDGASNYQQPRIMHPSDGIHSRNGYDISYNLGNNAMAGVIGAPRNVGDQSEGLTMTVQHPLHLPRPGDAVDDLMAGLEDDFVS